MKFLRREIKKLQFEELDQLKAIKKCDESIKTFPGVGAFYLDRANSLIILREPVKAIVDFNKAATLDPTLQAECSFSCVEIYKKQGKNELALKELNKIPEPAVWKSDQRYSLLRIRELLDLNQKATAQKEYIKLRDLCRARKADGNLATLKASFPEFLALPTLELKAPETGVPKVIVALKTLTQLTSFPTIAQIEDTTGVTLNRRKPQFEGDNRFDGTKDYLYVRVDQKNKKVWVFVNGYECAVSRQALLDGSLIVGDALHKQYGTSNDFLMCNYFCDGVYDSLKVCLMTWLPPTRNLQKSVMPPH